MVALKLEKTKSLHHVRVGAVEDEEDPGPVVAVVFKGQGLGIFGGGSGIAGTMKPVVDKAASDWFWLRRSCW